MKRLLFFFILFGAVYGAVIEVKSIDELIEKIHKTEGKVYVDCYTKECYPCRLLTPLFERWSGQKNTKDTFIKINIKEVADLASKYNISMVPTVLIFDKEETTPWKKIGLEQITDFFDSSH